MGFRPKWSCTEQIFTLHHIIEIFQGFKVPLTINFTDLNKAFDSIYSPSLWKILTSYEYQISWYVPLRRATITPVVMYKQKMATTAGSGSLLVCYRGASSSPICHCYRLGSTVCHKGTRHCLPQRQLSTRPWLCGQHCSTGRKCPWPTKYGDLN